VIVVYLKKGRSKELKEKTNVPIFVVLTNTKVEPPIPDHLSNSRIDYEEYEAI